MSYAVRAAYETDNQHRIVDPKVAGSTPVALVGREVKSSGRNPGFVSANGQFLSAAPCAAFALGFATPAVLP